MSAAQTWHPLCHYEDIGDPGARGFDVAGDGSQAERLFIVRKDALLAAYRNACPHTGAPLEWLPDQFFDIENSFLQCAMHGALFRPEDGFCVRGPCAGQSLQALPVRVDDGRVWVALTDQQVDR